MMGIIKNLFGLFLLIFISCDAQKKSGLKSENLYGKYVNNNLPFKNPNYEAVTILKDNVASYNIDMEVFGTLELKGQWEVKSDTLKLSFNNMPVVKTNGYIEVTYGNQKKEFINIKINDKFGLLFGAKFFINQVEYLMDSDNVKIKSQIINKIKIIYLDEIYEKEINRYANTDVTFHLTLPQYRGDIYEFVKDKWLIRDNKLIELKNNLPNKEKYLIKI